MSQYKPSILDKRLNIDTGYVSKLLSDVFGVESPVYVPWLLERTYKALPFTDVKEGTSPNGLAQPFSGVEVLNRDVDYDDAPVRFGQKSFGAFWLKGGTYKTWDYKGNLIDIELNDLLMPLATLVEFTRQKTVTKTPTSGGIGTVKEIYGMEDWAISISGIILPDNLNPFTQQTVAEQMESIQLFHELAGSIEVAGQNFAQRSITRIVTESLKFSPVQGKPNMMQYSIEAVSDGDLLLTDIL
jgi:hypothetical protein